MPSKRNIKMVIFICLFLIFISGCSEGIMDSIQFHFDKTRFSRFRNQQFWNPSISWRNKWKNGDPAQGEKFKFSSTFLVSLTDSWHLFKMIRNIGIFTSIPLSVYQIENLYYLIGISFLLRVFYGIGFQLTYK